MIGKYLDNQVTNLKKGVFAAATLFGLGFIIYKAITKRKAIAKTLGFGKGDVSKEEIKSIQGKPVEIASNEDDVQEGEIIDVDAIEDDTGGGEDAAEEESSNDAADASSSSS